MMTVILILKIDKVWISHLLVQQMAQCVVHRFMTSFFRKIYAPFFSPTNGEDVSSRTELVSEKRSINEEKFLFLIYY